MEMVAVLDDLTLEDTHRHLKDIQAELKQEIQALAINTRAESLPIDVTPEIVIKKQQKLAQAVLNNLSQFGYNRELNPVPKTIDVCNSAAWELEQQVLDTERIIDSLKTDISSARNRIAYLETQKNGLARMRETCIEAVENVGVGTDDETAVDLKRLFTSVKNDLAEIVDIMFPDHQSFRETLAQLTSAYARGGDDVYVDIDKRFVDCVKFLVEADIAAYHPNNKNQVRLMDLI